MSDYIVFRAIFKEVLLIAGSKRVVGSAQWPALVPVPLVLTALWVGADATDTERNHDGSQAGVPGLTALDCGSLPIFITGYDAAGPAEK